MQRRKEERIGSRNSRPQWEFHPTGLFFELAYKPIAKADDTILSQFYSIGCFVLTFPSFFNLQGLSAKTGLYVTVPPVRRARAFPLRQVRRLLPRLRGRGQLPNRRT